MEIIITTIKSLGVVQPISSLEELIKKGIQIKPWIQLNYSESKNQFSEKEIFGIQAVGDIEKLELVLQNKGYQLSSNEYLLGLAISDNPVQKKNHFAVIDFHKKIKDVTEHECFMSFSQKTRTLSLCRYRKGITDHWTLLVQKHNCL
jgi:hypothetical protein